MITIYIRLLDEGTDVFRPTQAELLENGLFKLLPTSNCDSEDERWEFIPGTVVKGEQRNLDGEEVLVAVEANYDGAQR